ncbi:zinc finger, CCHC-type containing protein, partial [Tanacetum coccineum]
AVVTLDLKLKTFGKKDIKCIFVGYVEHSNAFRFNVIEPNESISINSIIKSRNVVFDENRFSSVLRSSQRSLINGSEDTGGSVVCKEVTEEVTKEVLVQQPKPELRKSKMNRTPKNFRHEFQLSLIEGTRDEVFDQHSYCFNVEDDPKTFDEAIKFSMKDMGEDDVILGIRIKHESNGISISQSYYIEKVVKKFNYFDYTPVSTPMDTILEGYTNASWISNTKENSLTSGWVFLLGVALAAAGKEAEWLRNLILKITQARLLGCVGGATAQDPLICKASIFGSLMY